MGHMDQRILVITLNTWKCDGKFEDRLTWMADGLASLRPDIICLQEAFVCSETGDDTASFLAERLRKKLEALPARRKSRQFRGMKRDSWSNLAILNDDGVQRMEDVKLVEIEADQDRWAMQAKTNLANGQSLHIVNTHLTHVPGREGASARGRQATQIAELCGQRIGDSTVVCGDFNALWDSPELSPLRALPFESAAEDGSGGTWLGERHGGSATSRQIDFIEVLSHAPGNARVERRMTAMDKPVGPNGEFPSDHAALVVDIVFSSFGDARASPNGLENLELGR